jgi:hypothetical protein
MKTYVVVIVLDENARQRIEDPESPVGPVSAQTVHVHLGQKGRRETKYWCNRPSSKKVDYQTSTMALEITSKNGLYRSNDKVPHCTECKSREKWTSK